ncbi:leucine-rich repeat domain-containing protein [Blastopirellula marina]|uniref:Leucine Rich repeats (2 copies) n=1 Tax=Blastopirellula marina TaxID=124 RepID=A0A2S8GPA7_9BACT|nr:hypothetical protein [Blastopirellula marina]PQO46276.1 hypothetical protein C5Y93_09830 [Blastopirellula marina]
MNDPDPAQSKPRRHWFSFSLRGMLLLMLFICGLSAFLAKDIIEGREEQAIVDQVNQVGAYITYVHQQESNHGLVPGNPLLKSIFGENYLARVRELSLNGPIGEDVIVQLPQLRQLEILRIGPEKLSDRSVDALVRIPQLQVVYFDGTEITPQQLRRLAKSSSLIQLVLDRQTSTDAHLAQLKHFPHLESIHLWDLSQSGLGIPTTDAGIESLLDVDGLQHVSIFLAPHITDKSLEHISKLPNLRLLDIAKAPITNQGFAHLAGMTKLESLRIHADPPIQPIDVERIRQLKSLEKLVGLELRGKGFDDQFLAAIAPLPKLEWIYLAGTSITDADLPPLKECPALSRITLSGNSITPAGLEAIGFLNDPQVHPKDYYERKLPTKPAQP